MSKLRLRMNATFSRIRKILAVIFLSIAASAGEGTPRAVKSSGDKVRSVNVWMNPGLFGGGFAFYVDNKGNVFLQETTPGNAAKYLERRIVLRSRHDVWESIRRKVNVQNVLERPAQKALQPDEGKYEIAIALANDVVIQTFTGESTWRKQVDAIDPLISAANEAAERIKKENPTEFEECLPREFNNLHFRFQQR